MIRRRYIWPLLLFANVLAWSMLGFHRDTGAAPGDVRAPFDNAVQQRNDMIRELQEIKALLKEQNTLLRANAKKSHVPDPQSRK
jgi:hypothetical protein